MDQSMEYGQQSLNLPHDVVKLPSKGMFYTPKKESLKVGYLTANDENLLMSPNATKDGIVNALLRNKIYEPGFNIDQLLMVDVQAILMFLRNTAFGPEYGFRVNDPATNKYFDITISLDEVSYLPLTQQPDENGLFTYELPKSKKTVKFKLLNIGDDKKIESLLESYPKGMVSPVVTKRLETQIMEIDGNSDKGMIGTFITNMPISDSKDLRKFINECEPKMDLQRKVIAPSGEEVTVNVAFGVEFFRPFF
jgi:hypothetical protein